MKAQLLHELTHFTLFWGPFQNLQRKIKGKKKKLSIQCMVSLVSVLYVNSTKNGTKVSFPVFQLSLKRCQQPFVSLFPITVGNITFILPLYGLKSSIIITHTPSSHSIMWDINSEDLTGCSLCHLSQKSVFWEMENLKGVFSKVYFKWR